MSVTIMTVMILRAGVERRGGKEMRKRWWRTMKMDILLRRDGNNNQGHDKDNDGDGD